MSFWLGLGLFALVSLVFEAWVVARRGVRQQLGYFALLVGGTGWMAWVVEGQRLLGRGGWPSLELVAGLLGTVLLVLVPGILDRMLRRAFSAERYERAARIAGVREVLVPGAVSAAEREFFERIAAARAGRADDVVRGLRQLLVDAEPPVDEQIQEQIVTVLLFAERWREAATQFETHLGDDPARHPTLAVQMVRAYGALGDLERAAHLLHRLEERLHPADPAAQAVLLQARLQLLAYAGALHEVQQLLAHPSLRAMPPRMRVALLETARERSAAREQAAAEGSTAAARGAAATDEPSAPASSEGGEPAPASATPPAATPRAATPPTATPPAATPPVPVDRHLSLFLDGVAMRAASDLRSRPLAPTRSLPPATMTLVALNACAYLLFLLLLGEPYVGHHLIRGGASFHAAVRAGEWWRLWTAMYLHGGVDHLLLNLYGLFVLGRVVEPVLGTVRFLCVYTVAGLAGNLASVYNPSASSVFSLGSSGAVLGVMAALMVMLVLRRGAWPEGWRREVLVNLGVLLTIQLAIGAWWPIIDNYAHVGGLLGGAAAATLLVPGGLLGRNRLSQLLVVALLAALVTSSAWALSSLAQEDTAETLARLPRVRQRVGAVWATFPAGTDLLSSRGEGAPAGDTAAVHPLGVLVEPLLVPPPADLDEALGAAVRRYHAEVQRAAREQRGDDDEGHELRVEGMTGPVVPGWRGRAETLWVGREGRHFLAYARAAAPATVVVTLEYKLDAPPEPLFAEEVERLLGTVEVDESALRALPRTAAAPTAVPAPAAGPAPAVAAGPAPDGGVDAGSLDGPAPPPSRAALLPPPDGAAPAATATPDPASRAPR